MGNENEIKDINPKSKFLPKEIIDDEVQKEIYALETEFAASAKNKSVRFYVVLSSFVFVLVAMAGLLSWYLENRPTSSELGIIEFEEVRLKDLLEASKDIEARLRVARKELQIMKEQHKNDLQAIENTSKKNIADIEAKQMPEAKKAFLIKKEKTLAAQKMTKTEAAQKAEITDKEKEIADLEKQVEENKVQFEKGVTKAQAVINNYEKLHKLKMAKQRQQLILYYNPVLKEKQIRQILWAKTPVPLEYGELQAYKPVMKYDGIIDADTYSQHQQNVKSYNALIARLRAINYTNSIPRSLYKLEALNDSIVASYEQMSVRMASRLAYKNSLLANYDYAFRYLVEDEAEGGYLVDPRQAQNMRVYISAVWQAQSGTEAMVFRSDDEYIGRVRLIKQGGRYIARAIETVDGKKFEPFDKILITKKISGALNQGSNSPAGQGDDSPTGFDEDL